MNEREAERAAWEEIEVLVHRVRPADRLRPGYFRDPDWSLRDVVAHLGTWLAEAGIQFERMVAGTYDGHEDVDVDAVNAALLEGMRDQPWEVVWPQANAARTKTLAVWYDLPDRSTEVDWWVAKACAPHYAEHLPRLRDWVAELTAGSAA